MVFKVPFDQVSANIHILLKWFYFWFLFLIDNLHVYHKNQGKDYRDRLQNLLLNWKVLVNIQKDPNHHLIVTSEANLVKTDTFFPDTFFPTQKWYFFSDTFFPDTFFPITLFTWYPFLSRPMTGPRFCGEKSIDTLFFIWIYGPYMKCADCSRSLSTDRCLRCPLTSDSLVKWQYQWILGKIALTEKALITVQWNREGLWPHCTEGIQADLTILSLR